MNLITCEQQNNKRNGIILEQLFSFLIKIKSLSFTHPLDLSIQFPGHCLNSSCTENRVAHLKVENLYFVIHFILSATSGFLSANNILIGRINTDNTSFSSR